MEGLVKILRTLPTLKPFRPSMFAFATLLWVLLPSFFPYLNCDFFQVLFFCQRWWCTQDYFKAKLLAQPFFNFYFFFLDTMEQITSFFSSVLLSTIVQGFSLGRNLSLGHFLHLENYLEAVLSNVFKQLPCKLCNCVAERRKEALNIPCFACALWSLRRSEKQRWNIQRESSDEPSK